ncbi:hypothetical protein AKJ09_04077 [Labilithrix luteola]|uniref:BNR repeat domain protein n=1 Tax=Labilithrix luteola TaxID=1391654 RepID=A0A0K1PV48_9BACT|nr:RCC1 domain-containing protein [Labilithrix luteola]AKU97413.1 hypothetical protein AKJ09_04077 [Labilithrix luteola]
MQNRIRMMRWASSLALAPAVLAASSLVVVACSDDKTESFDPTPDASDASVANLPEAAAPTPDGGADVVDSRAPFDPTDQKVACSGAKCVTQLVAGDHHFCARFDDGTVECWGGDDSGALGRGDDPEPASKRVAGLEQITQLSAAGSSTCALSSAGKVSCWGSNSHGQLGQPTDPIFDEERHATPLEVALPGAALRIDVGSGGACAVLASGTHCWGDDTYGQLARQAFGAIESPGPAELGGSPIARTAIGPMTGFALTTTGDLRSFGALSGYEGEQSGRISSISPDPIPATILAGVSSFSVSSHACAIANGVAHCWGRDGRGALCTGLPDPFEQKPRVAATTGVAYPQRITTSGNTTCARMTDGTVQCCGSDDQGQLGRGKAGEFSTFFVAASSFTEQAVDVASGLTTVCALVQDGTVACWGGNGAGELGQGTSDDSAHPTPVKVAF